MCNGVGAGVAAGLGGAPRRGSGQVGWGAQPGAFGAGSPGSAGAGRGQFVQDRGDLQPGRPGDLRRKAA